MNKITKEIKSAKDLDSFSRIDSVSLEIKNESILKDKTLTLDKDFTFEKGFIPAIIMKMKKANATESKTSFENCGTLLGCDLTLLIQTPEGRKHQEEEAARLQKSWKRRLGNKLKTLGLIE